MEPPKATYNQEIVTTTCKIWLGNDGIVRAVMFPDIEETLDTAKENIEAGVRISGGTKRPLLLDMSNIKSMNKEARDYYARGDEREGCESAVALLVRSALSRMIGNFFMGLNKTNLPTRLFTDEDSAMAWLRTFL